jgi:hypothetical protein
VQHIVPLLPADLQDVRALQPEGWGDIIPYIEFCVQSPFCYPVKVVLDNKLILALEQLFLTWTRHGGDCKRKDKSAQMLSLLWIVDTRYFRKFIGNNDL